MKADSDWNCVHPRCRETRAQHLARQWWDLCLVQFFFVWLAIGVFVPTPWVMGIGTVAAIITFGVRCQHYGPDC